MIFAAFSLSISASAQGWPSQYGGVMLQGFYWDSYGDTQWSYLTRQADELSRYFKLIWVPQSGFSGNGNNMGYMPQYYFNQNSSFGTEGELRTMISTFKAKGTGFIADVVINHRNNLGQGGSWVDYPAETYKGTTYQMLPTDICSDDDGGNTASWASSNGISLSSNKDTGEGWDGCRDIDHKSANVNKVVKAYLDFLLNDLGYAGFRYDMVKGYSASFTGDYNSTAKPTYSVGEYWDGNASVVNNWMEGTKVNGAIQSGAFDFAFRYACRDASNSQYTGSGPVTQNWALLGSSTTSATNNTYKRYAVTFVENHDTEYRSASAPQDPIRRDTLALNAWLLANPGTPCVFLKHWIDYKHEIKLMIEARQLAGITNESATVNMSSSASGIARRVAGKNGNLIVVCGKTSTTYTPPTAYKLLTSGYHYAIYYDGDASSWASTVERIDAEDAKEPFVAHDATVYVKADFTPVFFYIWDSNNNTQLNGNWPGKQQTKNVTINGEQWYSQTVNIGKEGYYFNIIFNQGNGKPQTADIMRIDSDRYFIATLSGSSIKYTDVTTQYTDGINNPIADQLKPADLRVYSLQGQMVGTSLQALPSGIYIQNGRKVLVK